MSDAASTSTPDPLRATSCPRCEYLRLNADIPNADVCSECGWRYRDDLIVLVGRGRGRFDSLAGGSWRGTAAIALCATMLLFFWRYIGYWTVVVLILVVSQLAAVFLSPVKPRMQLWLSASGFAQIASTTEARVAQWFAEHAYWLALPFAAVIPFIDKPRNVMSWIIMLTSVVSVSAIMFLVWRPSVRRMVREVSPDDLSWLHPWSDAIEIEFFHRLPTNELRIRITSMHRWRMIDVTKVWLADVEISCSRETVSALSERLRQWSGSLPAWK